ncbi:hypothetical protein BN59_02836 [Legionella massiliensis]|uniref:Uncharacterized protein n=1 Tax=Legionella massiliensis TaxID=1034943 RepID=A0A078L058_9GAMM|nr:hypothetical protein [Legionella massiliensis]CDZ78526.1 hypothetical protein BN59_02836 [Legionella massiliensis]CEE14264.1 hypothetical protein BN1094_02836 [Legionella massiliensis]
MRSIHKIPTDLANQFDTPSYSQINSTNEQLPVVDGYCLIEDRHFYEVCKPEFKEQLTEASGSSSLNTHWKAHLSCTQDALPQLWEIVVPLLQQYDCPAFKCIRLATLGEADKSTVFGKRCVDALQFTIYIPAGEEALYVELLEKIEQSLLQANITKLPRTHDYLFSSDKRIGVYISVRHSAGLDGNYLSAEDALKIHESNKSILPYNCAGVDDPFEVMQSLQSMRAAEEQQKQRPNRNSMWQIAMRLQIQKQQQEVQQVNPLKVSR